MEQYLRLRSMNRLPLLALSLASISTLAVAQMSTANTDVLGAHLNYGRGCTACHSPHSGSAGNGKARSADASSSRGLVLWGEDATGLYGRTITTGGGKFTEVLPASMSANTPDVAGMLTCLSCHDGNFAPAAMMKNKVYETLPSTYGARSQVPTLIGSNGVSAGSFVSEHPMGLSANIHCGGSGWDCAEIKGAISMRGTNSTHFV